MIQSAKKKMTATSTKQNFDNFLVLDFEATCERGVQIVPQEIIEFPCLKISAKTFEIESQFHRYIRPRSHPNLTAFCHELTGITRDMVENEPEFPAVLKDFESWLKNERILESRFAFVTCGDWDLKTMLPEQCRQVGLSTPEPCLQWINIKKSYNKAMKSYPRHLDAMLTGLGMRFEGRPHSGIDDCSNIARVLKALAKRDFVYEFTWKKK